MKYARILRDVWVGGLQGRWLRSGEVVRVHAPLPADPPVSCGDVEVSTTDGSGAGGLWLAAGEYAECDAPPRADLPQWIVPPTPSQKSEV